LNVGSMYELATVSLDATIRLWKPENQSKSKRYPSKEDETKKIYHVSLSPNGKFFIAARGNGDIEAYDTETGQVVHRYLCPQVLLHIDRLATSPDDKLLACASKTRAPYVCIFNLEDGERMHNLDTEYVGISAIAWSNSVPELDDDANGGGVNGKKTSHLLAVSDRNFVVKIWNADLGECIKHIEIGNDEAIRSLCFAPDDSMLLGACETTRGIVWETDGWEEIRQLTMANGDAADAAFSADGAYLAVVCASRGYLWKCLPNVSFHKVLSMANNDEGVYTNITFTKDSQHVVMVNTKNQEDEPVLVFDVETGKRVECEDPYSLSLQVMSTHHSGFFGFPIMLNRGEGNRVFLPDNEHTIGFTIDNAPSYLKQYLIPKTMSTAVVVDRRKIHMFRVVE